MRSGFRRLSRAARLAGLAALIVSAAGCRLMPTSMFVKNRLASDQGFKATAEATTRAAAAYHGIVDAPLEAVHAREAELTELVRVARESYRKAATFRINLGSPRLATKGVVLTDDDEPSSTRVPAQAGAVLVVAHGEEEVTLLRFESERGKEVIGFDAGMALRVAPDLQPLLMGEASDVDFAEIVKRLRPVGGDLARPSPAPTTTPAVSAAVEGKCSDCGAALAPPTAKFCARCGAKQVR